MTLSAQLDQEIAVCDRLKREIPVIAGSRNFDEQLPTAIVGSQNSTPSSNLSA